MRTTKEHIVGYIKACGPMGPSELLPYLRQQDPSFRKDIDYIAELHDHINDLIKTGELKIYASFDASNDIGFVQGDAVVTEGDRQHITEADALRDEVERWRKEAAEQAEIAHKLRVALGNLVVDWERVHGTLPKDHEAEAALATEYDGPVCGDGLLPAAVSVDEEVIDALTDLIHACRKEGFDFESLLEMAREHAEVERDEAEVTEEERHMALVKENLATCLDDVRDASY